MRSRRAARFNNLSRRDAMSLPDAVKKLTAVLSAGGDSQAQQLELLHEIETALQLCPADEIKSHQADLEKQLTAALLQGPAPPLRHLISYSFCYAYGRGARQNMYTTVGLLLSWMDEKKKGSPASSVSSKAAILAVLGDLSHTQGGAMVALCHDTITLLIKMVRAKEVPLRTTACAALASALGGSGGIGRPVQEEAVKNLSYVISERGAPAELRCAVLAACPALIQYAEQMWATELLEQIATLCTKHMDDPVASVRHAASDALGGVLVAALSQPYITTLPSKDGKAQKSKKSSTPFGGPKKAEANSAIEAIAALLTQPFLKKEATKELRSGISRAFVAFTRAIARPFLERHAEFLLSQLQALLSAPAATKQTSDCVSHAMRAGLGEPLSERGQAAMAASLATAATARGAADTLVVVCLKEVSMLFLSLREVAPSARDALLQGERSILMLVEHPKSSEVRTAACVCLWALVIAFPQQLAGMLNSTMNALRKEHAKLAGDPGTAPVPDGTYDALLAHAHTVGALVCAIPHTPFGAPQALTTLTLNVASELASSPSEYQQQAAWVLLRGMMRLDPEWLGSKARLTRLYGLWKNVLGNKADVNAKSTVERELRSRAYALDCVVTFLTRLPENFSAPLLRPIVGSLLPPNTALLASCRESANSLQKELGQSFRPAFVLFRARLYELLGALPPSTLSAKLLNVVMPLVVADLVDPSSTLAPTCTALVPMLDENDAPLGGATDDERLPEPMKDGLNELALTSCDAFLELKGTGDGAKGESLALSAAVRLFASVFRLQTSEVRMQLLGHLATAAAKAAKDAAAASKGGMFGGSSKPENTGLSSVLGNVSAALLGSLTQLRLKPSKSPLVPSLSGRIDEVLGPCLADPDPAVRRAAAQAVSVTVELLGGGYATKFVADAQKKLTEPKQKDELKAGLALALGWLARANAANAADPSQLVATEQPPGPGVPLKQIVATLGDVAGDSTVTVCEWATHALSSIARAASTGVVASAEFRTTSNTCLGVASSLCLSEPPPNSHTAHAIARLSTMIVSALAADDAVHAAASKGGKLANNIATTINRCGVLNAAACALAPTPALSAEGLQHACALLALPPNLRPKSTSGVHASVMPGLISSGLKSRHTPLRRAALHTQRSLNELAASSGEAAGGMSREKLVTALFELIEYEPSEEAMEEAKLLLLSQLDGTAEAEPCWWLRSLRDVVLEVKKKKEASGGGGGGGGGGGDEGDGEEGEEGDGGGGMGASGLPAGDSTEDSEAARRAQKEAEMEAEEAKKWEHVSSRWQTRLLAVECVRRLIAVLHDPAHFDLKLARDAGAKERYLIEQLQELVSVAFTAATSPFEAVRPAGIVTLYDIADKFGQADDPDYDGKRLLELYSAQISAALRPCLSNEAEPALAAAGCAATSRYLLAISSSASGHVVDPVAVRKLLTLLVKLGSPAELAAMTFPAYSESSATMVRAASLQASAQLMQAASAPKATYEEILKQLTPSLPGLRDCWLALLRDLALLDTQPKAARKSYKPYLYAPATARSAHQQLLAAWPSVLAAVVAVVPTPAWQVGRENAISSIDEMNSPPTTELRALAARPAVEDAALLSGLCAHRLSSYAEQNGNVSDEEREEVILCLTSLQQLMPHASLPPSTMLRLVELLRAISNCIEQPDVTSALANLVESLCAAAAKFINPPTATPADTAALLPPLSALACAPILRHLPHITPSPTGALPPLAKAHEPPSPAAVPLLVASLKATAALPAAISSPATRLPYLPAALLVSLHAAHSAATHSLEPLAEAAGAAIRSLLAALPTEASGAPADVLSNAALIGRSTAATAHALLDATPLPKQAPLLTALIASAASLPSSGSSDPDADAADSRQGAPSTLDAPTRRHRRAACRDQRSASRGAARGRHAFYHRLPSRDSA